MLELKDHFTLLIGVIGSISAYFGLKKVIEENKKYKNQLQVDVTTLSGLYRSELHQTVTGGQENTTSDLHIKFNKHGKLEGTSFATYMGQSWKIDLTGGFYLEKFIKIEYNNSDPNVHQFGTMLLRLSDDGKSFSGMLVGYGHISHKIISGDICIKKV